MRILLAAAVTLHAAEAVACACCADRGARIDETIPVDQYVASELATLGGPTQARVYMTACGPDCVTGLAGPQGVYAVTLDVSDGALTLTSAGPAGQIVLPFSTGMHRFSVDTEPGSTGHTVMLYTELRQTGRVSASGLFAAADGAMAELVLSGVGNACWSAADLTGWTLTVTGKDADFSLFGALPR